MNCFRDGNECPYRKMCKEYQKDGNCYKMCTKFHKIDLLFYKANIPKRYLQPFILVPSTEEDQCQYEILNTIKNEIYEFVREGRGLYIFSRLKLNGKTSWGIKILQNYIHLIKDDDGNKTRALYVDVGIYLQELKSSFDDKNSDISDFKYDIDNADLVVWDNIDEIKLSEWEAGIIKQHIKRRISNKLSNIFIGTNTGAKLDYLITYDLRQYVENDMRVELYSERGAKNDRISNN